MSTPANNTRSRAHGTATSDIDEGEREESRTRTPNRPGTGRPDEETLTLSAAGTPTRSTPPKTRAARTLEMRTTDPIPTLAIEALLEAIRDLRTTIAAQPTATADVLLD